MSKIVWHWPPVPKSVWGPAAWNWLHTLAINYPAEPSRAQQRAAHNEIINFLQHLPCDDCRVHAAAYTKAAPPDVSSSDALQVWAWRFHNYVNRKTGRRLYAYDDYRSDYQDEIQRAALSCEESCMPASRAGGSRSA